MPSVRDFVTEGRPLGALRLPRNTDKFEYFPLGGGLDLVTPAISIPSGRLKYCLNFEPHVGGGYIRTPGYERYDGGKRPSDAKVSLYIVTLSTPGIEIETGNRLGAASDASDAISFVRAENADIFNDVFDDIGAFESVWVVWFEDISDDISVPKPYGYLNADTDSHDINLFPATGSDEDSTGKIYHSSEFPRLEGRMHDKWKNDTFDFEIDPLRNLKDAVREEVSKVSGADSFPVKGAWRRGKRTFAWCQDADSDTANTELYVTEVDGGGWRKAATVAPTTNICIAVKFYGGSDDNLTVDASEWKEGVTVQIGTDFQGVVRKLIDWTGGYDTGVPGVAAGATGYLVIQAINDDDFDADDWITFSPYGTAQRVAKVKGFSTDSHVKAGFGRDGTFQFIDHNFFGNVEAAATYGCTGEDRAFVIANSGDTNAPNDEWENDQYIMPVVIPVVSDLVDPDFVVADEPAGNPIFIEKHQNRLFLAYPGGRFVASSAGEPLNFSAILSAVEFSVGEEITGMLSSPGGVLIITTETRTMGLYGRSDTWDLRPVSLEFGAKANSLQHLNSVFGLNDGGVMELLRADTVSDFDRDVLGRLVNKLVRRLRKRFIGAYIIRSREQYVMFFDTSVVGEELTTALVMYYPKRDAITHQRGTSTAFNAQFGLITYPLKVNNVYLTRNEFNEESLLMASEEAYLFEVGIGTSFDGDPIPAYVSTPFSHSGSPGYNKHYHHLRLELFADSPVDLQVTTDLEYSTDPYSQLVSVVRGASFGAGHWDTDTWGQFRWDGRDEQDIRVPLLGDGTNISIGVAVESDTVETLILQGVTLDFVTRRPIA